jgi:hypothetical protein
LTRFTHDTIVGCTESWDATEETTMYKVLGTNDETTTCECCGRTDLKKTVVLSNGDHEVRYGTECAARLLKVSKNDVAKSVRAADRERVQSEIRESARRDWEESQRYDGWLLATFGDTRSDMTRRKLYRSLPVSA